MESLRRLLIVLCLVPATIHAAETYPGYGYEPTEGSHLGEKEYSPYLHIGYPRQVFWGDTHLHTSYSTDAGMIGNRLGPEEAYRFARGKIVVSSSGVRARLQRPLDFLVIADHAENLGLAPMIAEQNPELLETEFGREIAESRLRRQVRGCLHALGAGHEHTYGSARRSGCPDPHDVGAIDGGRRCSQRTGPLHRPDRLRVVVQSRRQQPAPQRGVSRRQGRGRSGDPVLQLRLDRPGRPVGLDEGV